MKKISLLFLVFIGIIMYSGAAFAAPSIDSAPDFAQIFEEHGANMLLVDAKSGEIIYANKAACNFYGYTKEQMLHMRISDINTMPPEEIQKEMQLAAQQESNHFVFRHKLSNGEIRTVEVYSCPHTEGDRQMFFSTIYDITAQSQLSQQQDGLITGFIMIGVILIALLIATVIGLKGNIQKLKESKEQIENLNALHKAFIEAGDSYVYLKDEALRYVFVNSGLRRLYGFKEEEMVGKTDLELTTEEIAQTRRVTDEAVLATLSLVKGEVVYKSRLYKTTKFPVKMLNGKYGVGAYVLDITEQREMEKRIEKELLRNQILVETINSNYADKMEQLDYVLQQSLLLTQSKYGFVHLYNEDEQEFTLVSWTKDVMQDCTVINRQTKYALETTGVWGDVVRLRRPVIVNDFTHPPASSKGVPMGHVKLTRFMSVPVIIDGKIVLVVGLANKETDYDNDDVYQMIMLMSGTWHSVERRETREKLALERNRYLQTLVSIGDGVLVVNHTGNIEMINTVAENMTGWTLPEAQGRHYTEVFHLSHEYEGGAIDDPIAAVFRTDKLQELGSHAVLTSRTGERHCIEDSASPIRDEENRTVGVILVFRDVTDKKKQREEIEFLSFHDSLTGLYNRGFFESELRKLDKEENLPVSILVADVNGLKLTNDIFGHRYGDILLVKVAKVMQGVSRPGDILARWGGDEFAMLLPGTSATETAGIAERIKADFARVEVGAMKGSVSVGFAVKVYLEEDIIQVLNSAEEKMYLMKTLERDKTWSSAIDEIISSLHEKSVREKEHSVFVSNLSADIGKEMGLPEHLVRKLRDAGFLHDIGKIVLDSRLINKNHSLSDQEWSEMRKHTMVGYRILNLSETTVDLAEAILTHHERWDGKGYPKGIKGEEIPVLARILAVAESFDRMIHDSDNTSGMSEEQALQEIAAAAGKQFDPAVVEAFVRMMGKRKE